MWETLVEFTVKSLCRLWESKNYMELPYKHWWNNWVPLKINFFEWHVVFDRLLTKYEPVIRGITMTSPNCDFVVCVCVFFVLKYDVRVIMLCSEIWFTGNCGGYVNHAESIKIMGGFLCFERATIMVYVDDHRLIIWLNCNSCLNFHNDCRDTLWDALH